MKVKLVIILAVVFLGIGTFFVLIGTNVISLEKITEEKQYLLGKRAQIGDYVSYDAGVWAEDKAIPNGASSFTFGGYVKDDSKNNSISCGYNDLDKNGWRVFKIDDGQVTLISAATSVCYYHGYGASTNDKSISILSGEDETISLDDFSDGKFAESVKVLSKEDVDTLIGSDTKYQRIENDLIAVGNPYWLASKNGTYDMWYVTEGGTVASNHVGVYGIRILVTLKNDVKTINRKSNEGWQLMS